MPAATLKGWWAMQDLSSNESSALLQYARQVLIHWFERKPPPKIENLPAVLQVKAGCFVTLKKENALRGCIGTFDADHPLCRNIGEMTINAAFRDFRFPPLKQEELKKLRIEISVLHPPAKIQSIKEIVIGRHGIIVENAGRRGVYLPEVAVEQGWSAGKFVEHCAIHKAGIHKEDVPKAVISIFEVKKYSEK